MSKVITSWERVNIHVAVTTDSNLIMCIVSVIISSGNVRCM